MKHLFILSSLFMCVACGNSKNIVNDDTSDIYSSPSQIKNFHEIEKDLYRSGEITKENIGYMASTYNLKTILSVEAKSDDEAKAAKKYGIKYIDVPMAGIGELDKKKVFAALNYLKTEQRPLLVHCYRGSERTGIVVGAYRIDVNKWTYQATIKEMNDYGFMSIFEGWQEDLCKYFFDKKTCKED